jgi:hypothetical protein
MNVSLGQARVDRHDDDLVHLREEGLQGGPPRWVD